MTLVMKQTRRRQYTSILVIVLACQAIAWGAEASPHADQVRGLNNNLLRLHGELRRTTRGEGDVQRIQAAEIIEQRAAALSALMQQDPGQALSLSFSPETLADLAARFPQSAASLEAHGGWQGPIEYYVEDDFEHHTHRSVRRMRVGDELVQIHFAGPEPAGLQSGDVLAVNGVRVGSEVAVSEAAITASTAVAAAACSTTGVQNTAVLLVSFPGWLPPPTLTPQSVHDTFFGTTGHSLDGYWREASYGKASAAGDVFGWYTLDRPYACSEGSLMRDAAIAKAVAAGANFQNYTRVFVIYPNAGCVAGFAQVGCSALSTPSGSITASTSYIEADYMGGDQGVYFVAHEGGHNLGLQHAGTFDFGAEALGPLGSTGTVNEFGDEFSLMGSQTLGQYSAQHKAEILNWLGSGSNYQVVQSSGTWSLQPFETSPAGLEALKIQRGTGNNAWLWLEYRQPLGVYDSTVYFEQPSGGAFIHYEDPTTGAFTHLLDFTPQTNSWYDPALLPGQTWVDPYTNVSVSVQSATSSALTVNVNYGATPCTHANPTVSASPLNPSTSPGKGVPYNVSVTNNDSPGCSAGTFNLSSSLPSGWLNAFSTSSLTLSPGQTGSVTMTKTPPAGTSAATYTVIASSATGTFTGSTTANCTVTATPALAVSVSTPSSTYSVGQTVPLAATVLYGSSPAASASISFTLTQPNGSKTTKSMRADSAGHAVWSYKIGPKSPRGVYKVVATASYNSQIAASNTASFTVQ